MKLGKKFKFKARMWPWNPEKGAWHFVALPIAVADEIKFEFNIANFGQRRGFGSVKCCVTIGNTTFETSMFPASSENTYLIPIKKSVRIKEGLSTEYDIELEIDV